MSGEPGTADHPRPRGPAPEGAAAPERDREAKPHTPRAVAKRAKLRQPPPDRRGKKRKR